MVLGCAHAVSASCIFPVIRRGRPAPESPHLTHAVCWGSVPTGAGCWRSRACGPPSDATRTVCATSQCPLRRSSHAYSSRTTRASWRSARSDLTTPRSESVATPGPCFVVYWKGFISVAECLSLLSGSVYTMLTMLNLCLVLCRIFVSLI